MGTHGKILQTIFGELLCALFKGQPKKVALLFLGLEGGEARINNTSFFLFGILLQRIGSKMQSVRLPPFPLLLLLLLAMNDDQPRRGEDIRFLLSSPLFSSFLLHETPLEDSFMELVYLQFYLFCKNNVSVACCFLQVSSPLWSLEAL